MRLPIVGVCLGSIAFATCQLTVAQEPQWWTNQKKTCGLSSSLDYNSWVKSGSPCSAGTTGSTTAPAGLTPQQQMGLAVGKAAMPYVQQAVHDLFYGAPTVQPQLDPAQQQRELAAQQLDDSGVYLLKQRDFAGAINEFQKALDISPSDQNVQRNLALAKQQLKDAASAGQTSDALRQLLGNAPANGERFDFYQLTNSSVANPSASPLGLANLEAGVVDLRGTTRTSPEALKSDLDTIFANEAPASASSRLNVVLPQDKDMELLFQSPPPSPPMNKTADQGTADSLVELDKILDTKANQDLQSQLDWFNKVYLPAHPELQNPQPTSTGRQPHD
jgi:tetratricopeptide (TPR) repeat protein